MADEKILIEVEVDTRAASKNIQEQTRLISDLTNSNKVLAEENKKLSKNYAENSAEISRNNAQIAKNKAVITDATKSRRNSIKELNSENNSLNALRISLAKNVEERNNINKSTKDGQKRFSELNKEILKQTNQLKAAEQAGGDFRRSVGNYGVATTEVVKSLDDINKAMTDLTRKSKALDITTEEGKKEYEQINIQINNYKNTINNLNKTTNESINVNNEFNSSTKNLSQSFTQAVGGINVFGTSLDGVFKLIIGNPIGLLLTALTSLVAIFAKTQSGAEFFRKTGAALNQVFGLLSDAVEFLGNAMIDAFSNPVESLNNLTNTIKEGIVYYFTEFIPNAIQKVIDGFGLLGKAASLVFDGEFSAAADVGAEAMLKLGDGITDLNPATAILKTAVKEAIPVIKEIAKEVEKTANAAFGLETALIANEKAIADQQVVVAQSIRSQKELNLLIEDQTAGTAERIAAAEKFAAVEQAQINKSIELQKERIRILKAQNDLTNSTEEDIQRVRDAEIELANLQAASFERQVTNQNKLNTIRQQQTAQELAEQKAKDEAEAKRQAEIDKAKAEKDAADSKAQIETAEKTATAKGIILENSAALASKLGGEQSVAAKAAGIAQATISTYTAIVKALELGPIAGPIAAGTIGALGFANVANIAGVQFAKGGLTEGGMFNGPSHANGGIKFAAGGRIHEAEGGEAIINKRSTAMFKPVLSAINAAGGGKRFAKGGEIPKFANGGVTFAGGQTSSIDSAINGENSVANQLAKQGSVQVAVTDINKGQNNVSVKQRRASI